MTNRRPCSQEKRLTLHRTHRRRMRQLEDQCVMVPVEPFRLRFLRLQSQGQMTLSGLCVTMGWVYRPSEMRLRAEQRRPGAVKPNTSLAKRALGMERRPGRLDAQHHVTYETALRLTAALGMDPHEAGV
jgi:hypothetical protein